MQCRPIAPVSKLNTREIDAMEVDIVFPHELIKFDILRIEPPFLPSLCVVGCYTRVSNRSVKLRTFQLMRTHKEKERRVELTQTSEEDHDQRATTWDCGEYSQNTFPFRNSSSGIPRGGVGTPQVKSRVRGVGRNPCCIRASVISPSELMVV